MGLVTANSDSFSFQFLKLKLWQIFPAFGLISDLFCCWSVHPDKKHCRGQELKVLKKCHRRRQKKTVAKERCMILCFILPHWHQAYFNILKHCWKSKRLGQILYLKDLKSSELIYFQLTTLILGVFLAILLLVGGACLALLLKSEFEEADKIEEAGKFTTILIESQTCVLLVNMFHLPLCPLLVIISCPSQLFLAFLTNQSSPSPVFPFPSCSGWLRCRTMGSVDILLCQMRMGKQK